MQKAKDALRKAMDESPKLREALERLREACPGMVDFQASTRFKYAELWDVVGGVLKFMPKPEARDEEDAEIVCSRERAGVSIRAIEGCALSPKDASRIIAEADRSASVWLGCLYCINGGELIKLDVCPKCGYEK